MSAGEATVNSDGTTNFEEPLLGEESIFDETPPVDEEAVKAVVQGIDPAVYLLVSVLIVAALYYFLVYRKKSNANEDGFFSDLDGDKFNLKLPAEVDEYYVIKDKCEASGWEAGQGPGPNDNPNGPSRILAQALMKRAIADIPVVTYVQKESPGMNKLYSQSMCSVKQWRLYQAAESMVSAEVEEVRAEADEIEPGWSQLVWRQAMQYHSVLKQKHEQELKAAEDHAKKRKEVEQKVLAAKAAETQAPPVDDADARVKAAEKAAEELIKAEEREKQSKKSFPSSGKAMKKGFLDGKGKKKK